MTTTEAPFELPKTIRLEMTQDDIDTAECNSRQNCVIARNLYRQLQLPVGRVRVSTAGVSIAKNGYRYYYRVPKRACRVVEAFDSGQSVKPIVYQIKFSNRNKIQSVNTTRKAQVNAARQARTATAKAAGIQPKTYPKGRYGI